MAARTFTTTYGFSVSVVTKTHDPLRRRLWRHGLVRPPPNGGRRPAKVVRRPLHAEQAQTRKEFAGVPKSFKETLTGLKSGRDTRTLLENRREGLRGGMGTDGRGKSVKEIRREKGKTPTHPTNTQTSAAVEKSQGERRGGPPSSPFPPSSICWRKTGKS